MYVEQYIHHYKLYVRLIYHCRSMALTVHPDIGVTGLGISILHIVESVTLWVHACDVEYISDTHQTNCFDGRTPFLHAINAICSSYGCMVNYVIISYVIMQLY